MGVSAEPKLQTCVCPKTQTSADPKKTVRANPKTGLSVGGPNTPLLYTMAATTARKGILNENENSRGRLLLGERVLGPGAERRGRHGEGELCGQPPWLDRGADATGEVEVVPVRILCRANILCCRMY